MRAQLDEATRVLTRVSRDVWSSSFALSTVGKVPGEGLSEAETDAEDESKGSLYDDRGMLQALF